MCWFCINACCVDVLVLYQRLLCRYAGSVTTLVVSMFVLQVSITKHTVVSVIFHASFYHHTNPLFQSYSMQVFITTQSVVSVIFHACVIITYTVVSGILHATVYHHTYRCFVHIPCNYSSPRIPLFQSYSMQVYFRQRWRDDRLQYNMTNVTQFTLSNRFMNHIWKPPTYFLNGRRSKLHNITVPNEFVRIESNGNIYMSKR